MQRPIRAVAAIVLVLVASCGRGAKPATVTQQAPAPALAPLAAQRIVVTPTVRVILAETDPLLREAGSPSAVARMLDAEIGRQLQLRGVGAHWIMPAELMRAFERNRNYATDPQTLAVEPIRAQAFVAGGKYGEPLSTQLRTMIALHNDARMVLLPAGLQVQKGRTTLRVALLDPRAAEAVWVGDVMSDSAAVPSRASLAQVAGRLAALFVAP